MIEKEFFNLLYLRLGEGESSLSFRKFMFSNFSSWKHMKLQDIRNLLETIKENELSLYAFLPFFYNFLGVDLIDDIRKMNNREADLERVIKVEELISKIPFETTVADFIMMEELNVSFAALREVRLSLLEQGAKKAEKIYLYW